MATATEEPMTNEQAASIPKGRKLTAPAKGAWRGDVPERARALCLLGLTDAEIAGHFGVAAETFCRWKKAHPELAEAMQGARAIADARVAASLYQRAVGYSVECEDVKMVAGEPQIVRYRKTFPPDVAAQIFWLKNRRPDLWRDKVESAVTGAAGGEPVRFVVQHVKPATAQAQEGAPDDR